MPHPSSETERFILARVQPLARTGDRVVVSVGEQDELAELPAWAVKLLSRCHGLKTLDDHARDAWEALDWRSRLSVARSVMGQMSPQAIARLDPGRGYFARMIGESLTDLARRGLFLGRSALTSALAADLGAPAPITTLGISSGHRVDSLQSCLESYIANNRRWGRSPRHVVCDDSRDDSTQADYRGMLARLAHTTAAEIHYAGRGEKERFVVALARHGGFDPQLLRFAFATPDGGEMAAGANRNAFLLQTVGERVASVDDDTLCKIYLPAALEPGMRVAAPGKAPFSVKMHRTRAEVLASAVEADHDLLALYEAHLGETVARCVGREVARGGEGVDIAALQGELLHEVLRGKGRVIAVFNGLVGDSGSNESSAHILHGRDQALACRDEAEFLGFAHSREIDKHVSKPVLVRPSGCMTTFFALDNASLIPPFFPRFRNSDGVFGLTIGALSSEWYFAHVPFQLLHAPATARRRLLSDARGDARFCFTPSQVVRACISVARPGLLGSDETTMTRRLGDALLELVGAEEQHYRRSLTQIARFEKGQELDAMEQVLARHPRAPDYWKHEVKRAIAHTRAQLSSPVVLADSQSASEHGHDEAERRARRMIHDYGQLLRIWPDVRRAALELKQAGTSLARPIPLA